MPRASAGSPPRKNGTSAPSATPISMQPRRAAAELPQPVEREQHVAASELPPPRPPPIGMRLVTAMSTPARQPVAALSACAARTARSLSAGNAAPSADAPDRAVVAPRERDRVAEVERDEQRLER